jgi:uncharacterized protein (DUF1330 family)
MSITLCVMLWASPGCTQQLAEYEDRVLARLAAYGARLLTRVSSLGGGPTEVQVLEFPSEDALEAFRNDPERLALAGFRAESIARTEIMRVAVVASVSHS